MQNVAQYQLGANMYERDAVCQSIHCFAVTFGCFAFRLQHKCRQSATEVRIGFSKIPRLRSNLRRHQLAKHHATETCGHTMCAAILVSLYVDHGLGKGQVIVKKSPDIPAKKGTLTFCQSSR